MGRTKNYKIANDDRADVTTPVRDQIASAVFAIPSEENASELRTMDLRKWLGKGQDAWVFAFADVFRSMLESGSVTPVTLAGYGRIGVPALLNFFREIGCEYAPGAVTKTVVKRFVAWARVTYPNGSTAKTYYQKAKAILTAMIELGILRVELDELFPRNPFAGANGSAKSAEVLSEAEEQRVAAALKRDLIAIHRRTFPGTNADARVVQLLHIALRTGINTAPLLELKRDAVSPNPLAPGLLTMETMKRRATATHRTSIRKSVQHDDLEVVPMDGAAILNVVLRETDEYVAAAPRMFQGRVWLYKSDANFNRGAVRPLTASSLFSSIASIVSRHDLRGDDGEPLRLNVSRLRVSKVNRQFRMSGGDVVATASENSHTPAVADAHYLQMTPKLRAEAATFVGTVFPGILSGEEERFEKTPVDRCTDTLHGEKAPRDGVRHCDRFTECIGCSSFVVVGSEPDLYRLYSYQRFLEMDLQYSWRADLEEWRKQRREQIDTIDRITKDFPASVRKAAKGRANIDPHPFWKAYMTRFLDANSIGGADPD